MKTPFVFVIVLNFNGIDWLYACLTSLMATSYSAYKVILVDNDSTDESVSFVQTEFPQVEIIRNTFNLGFSEGNNVGIERALVAGADYVVLLNPDTKVAPDWLEKIIQVGEAEPTIGVLGSVQYCYENNEYNAWTKAVALQYLRQLTHSNSPPAWIALEWVEGSCFAVKREVFERIGYLDPIYFSFYEEIDFCRRAACVGYKTVLVTYSRIHHHRGGIWAVQQNRQRDYLCDRGQFIYSLTDPRRSLAGNLKWWFITFGTKLKASLWPPDFKRFANLVQIQLFLITNLVAVYNKWKREQLQFQ